MVTVFLLTSKNSKKIVAARTIVTNWVDEFVTAFPDNRVDYPSTRSEDVSLDRTLENRFDGFLEVAPIL